MVTFKRLDLIIGKRHFGDTFVCTDIEKTIREWRPEDTEFLSGRIVPLTDQKSTLILIFEKLDDRHSIVIAMELENQVEKSCWYVRIQQI
jgi:hypothetical protein